MVTLTIIYSSMVLSYVKNSKPLNEDPYRNTYLQYSKLSRMIDNLPPKQILIALDVCYGGTFNAGEAKARSRGNGQVFTNISKENLEQARNGKQVYANINSETYFEEKLGKKTRIYLTSGGKNVVPDGYDGKHSPFAQRLIQALQTKGAEGKILTATDLYQFVQMLPSGPLLGSFGDDEAGSEYILMAK